MSFNHLFFVPSKFPESLSFFLCMLRSGVLYYFFISPISIGASTCFKLQKHGIISLASITLMYIYSSIYCILKTRIFGFISFLRSPLFKFRGKTLFSLVCISRPSTMNTPYLLLLHRSDKRGYMRRSCYGPSFIYLPWFVAWCGVVGRKYRLAKELGKRLLLDKLGINWKRGIHDVKS